MTIRSSRTRGFAIVAALVAALAATQVQAQAPAAPAGAAAAYSAQELEGLVGRIALYPDDLVAIILPASTNPLQIVQADRFLEKRKADPKAPVDEKWDEAVKSLLNYPEVIKTMSKDLDWTADLGEAVVTDQGAVMEAVQAFRRKTQAAGNLKSDDKQTVVVEKEVVKIVPANPEVIYVPQYQPSTVVVSGGYSAWGYYPSPYPVYYYPYAPGAAFATGLIWGAAITAAWNGGHYNCGWGGGGNNNININRNTNIQGGDRTVNRGDRQGQRPSGGGSQWKPSKQPGQVSGSVGRQPSGGRVGDGGRGGQAGGGRDFGGRDAGGGARPSQQSAGGRDFGGRDGGGRDAGGGGAFGGAGGSGRDARMDSARGASSRDSMGGARASGGGGARPSAGSYGGGGGARASGGGGGARAGGGGGGGARGGGGGGGRGGGRR
jgi:hypothetical protein